jgi:hypothetical protein
MKTTLRSEGNKPCKICNPPVLPRAPEPEEQLWNRGSCGWSAAVVLDDLLGRQAEGFGAVLVDYRQGPRNRGYCAICVWPGKSTDRGLVRELRDRGSDSRKEK